MSSDSPFVHRLRRNYIARPDEELGIKGAIEKECTLIRDIDLKVADIDRAIAALGVRKEGLLGRKKMHQRSVRDHKALLWGILHLPADILSEIFLDLVPVSGEWSLGIQKRPHPIVRISHVCRQWRDVALSNPLLWTTLDIRNLPLYKGSSAHKVDLEQLRRKMALITEMASVFISRADTSPMTLSITEGDPTSQSAMPAYAESIQLLASVLREARWAKTQLILTIHHTDSPLLLMFDVVARSGETLHEAKILLTFYGMSIAKDVVGRFNLDNMEHLSVLHLGLPEASALEARVRWNALTELRLYAPVASVGDAIGILSRCPNLIRFDVATPFSHPPSQPLPPRRSITHPRLHTLIVFGDARQLVETFVLPALFSLQILNTRDSLHQPLDFDVPPWDRNYGAQLTHVAFNYECLDISTLLRCLEDLLVVISLEIAPIPIPQMRRSVSQRFSDLHRSALHALTANWDESGRVICVCPKLQQLTLHAPDTTTNSEDWAKLISSRRGVAPRPMAYLKMAEICVPSHGSVVANMQRGVCFELARRGISVDGLKFRVEECWGAV